MVAQLQLQQVNSHLLFIGKNYATANLTVSLPVAGTYTFYVSNTSAPNLGVKYNGTTTLTVVDADRTVLKGTDAFVYEHIAIDGAPTANKLTKYSEGSNPTAVNQISGSSGVFYLTEAAVNDQYGAYYYAGQPSSSSPVDTFIYIWYPELSIQAELTPTPQRMQYPVTPLTARPSTKTPMSPS